jgi:ethanolamine transporter EutH
MVVTMLHTFDIATSAINFSFFDIFMTMLLPTIVAVFLLWYAKLAERKGWIS